MRLVECLQDPMANEFATERGHASVKLGRRERGGSSGRSGQASGGGTFLAVHEQLEKEGVNRAVVGQSAGTEEADGGGGGVRREGSEEVGAIVYLVFFAGNTWPSEGDLACVRIGAGHGGEKRRRAIERIGAQFVVVGRHEPGDRVAGGPLGIDAISDACAFPIQRQGFDWRRGASGFAGFWSKLGR